MSTKSLKPTKPPMTPLPPSSKSPSLSNHLATIELRQRILNSLSRLSDRDTHQIAVDDLETIIKTISPDTIPIVLNSLYAASTTTNNNNNTAVRKEAIRLLSVVCATHTESTATHLNKIIAHIVKTLKDSDSGVKDSCRESIGHLSFLYLKGDNSNNLSGSVVSLFVKPLFDAMNEQNKGVQSGAAMCMAKMVEMASDPPVLSFQKLCCRICKFLNSPNFLANAALLPVVSSLSQVGAISPQFLEPLLQSIHDCLSSSDWSTRKAAADTLNALALHSSNLIKQQPTSTISILEACRFDKIKPVRDSITEALQLWKFIAEDLEDQKTAGHYQDSLPAKLSIKDLPKLNDKRVDIPVIDGQTKGHNVVEKSTGTKKKAPPLSDKELNPEFFQRLERRVSGEVEVIVNRRFIKSSDFQNEEETEVKENDVGEKSKPKSEKSYHPDEHDNLLDHSVEREGGDLFSRRRELDNKGNLLGIQRQLLQLERQQAQLMNMLQDFKGGSRDGMVTLENRVWGLERVVEDMARNLSVSMNTLRKSCYINGFRESSERSFGKYNGFLTNYANTKLMRNDDGLSYMGRGSSWDYHTHGPNMQMGSTRGVNSRSPKRVRPVRFGEGHLGDMDMAFGEALASGDDLLIVKLIDKTGLVIDQLSSDVASEVLHAVARFLLEPNLFDICLSWIQQLLDMIIENGTDVVRIPLKVKREILVNLNKASSTIDPPENWEGLMPDQLLLQLASAWDINLQQLYK